VAYIKSYSSFGLRLKKFKDAQDGLTKSFIKNILACLQCGVLVAVFHFDLKLISGHSPNGYIEFE